MKVTITGGAGYLGSQITKHLLDMGFTVEVVDTLLYEKTSLTSFVGNKYFSFKKGDVRNRNVLDSVLKTSDVIIPLAALVGAPLCDRNPVDAKLVNYEHVKYLAENKSKEQKILYPNSNSGYGITQGDQELTEEDEMKPISIYGTTKLDAEKSVRSVDNFVTFRLATVFGVSTRPRMDLLVNNLVLRAIKDKVLILYQSNAKRNYIHIQDICRSFSHSILNWENCKNNTFNVGNDDLNCTKLDLCNKIKEYIETEIVQADYTTDPDKRDYKVSSKKFYDTGFKCIYTLDDGIKELIQMFPMIDNPQYANY